MSQNMVEIFHKAGVHRKLLKEIENDYESAILTIFDTFSNFKRTPKPVICKTEKRSNEYRTMGNVAFCDKYFGEAFSLYNMAIMHAPCDSYTLLQAYSNRSVLLLKLGKPDESIQDIEIGLNLSPCDNLKKKLLDRKSECLASSFHTTVSPVPDSEYKQFFELNGKPHKNIPCATDAIKIIGNRVVADRDINVGEIISVETAYVSCLKNTEVPVCCHHCHKFSYNMIPCKTCCFVMYCAEECLQKSWNEVHKLECEVNKMTIMRNFKFRLSVQAVLKAVISSGGVSQYMFSVINADATNDSYNEAAYLNLCKKPLYEQLCRRGRLFECALNAALIVHTLSWVPSLMPVNKKEKKRIMLFLGKQIMFHCENTTHLVISAMVVPKDKDRESVNSTDKAYGLFPFTGMVNHSCFPNVELYGHENKNVLVSVHNISKGTELTISYLSHFFTDPTLERKRNLYIDYGFVCKCQACCENWEIEEDLIKVNDLPKMQQDFLHKIGNIGKFLLELNSAHGNRALNHFDLACKGMTMFRDYPRSIHYKFFLDAFQSCYHTFQGHIAKQDIKGVVNAYSFENEM